MEEFRQNSDEVLASANAPGDWPWKIFVFSLLLLGATLGSVAGLKLGYGPYLTRQISDTQAKIDALALSVPLDEQNTFLRFYSQIVNLKNLLSAHLGVERIFAFLEKNTNQRLTYEALSFNATRREMILEGVTATYQNLAEQLLVFKQAPEVESSILSQSQLADGRIHFRLSLIFKPAFLAIKE